MRAAFLIRTISVGEYHESICDMVIDQNRIVHKLPSECICEGI
jgi:hypothetical protein